MGADWLDAIHLGDTLDVLRALPDACMDALICDPPAGIGYLGHDWDGDRGGSASWIAWLADVLSEARRVLKPGAHALLWAIPRTSHWTATALEAGGFELRTIIHDLLPGDMALQGFLDGLAPEQAEAFARLIETASSPILYALFGNGQPRGTHLHTEIDAIQGGAWAGWNTNLKPAAEHWLLARAPIAAGSVPAQIEATGTGALNVGALRVGTTQTRTTVKNLDQAHSNNFGRAGIAYATQGYKLNPPGRWPAHLRLMHSADCAPDGCAEQCPAAQIGAQAEYFTQFHYTRKPADKHLGCEGLFWRRDDSRPMGYAQVERAEWEGLPTTERAQGNIHSTVKNTEMMRWLVKLITPPGGIVADVFCGSGSTLVAAIAEGRQFFGVDNCAEAVTIAQARCAYAATRSAEPAKVKRMQPPQQDAQPARRAVRPVLIPNGTGGTSTVYVFEDDGDPPPAPAAPTQPDQPAQAKAVKRAPRKKRAPVAPRQSLWEGVA